MRKYAEMKYGKIHSIFPTESYKGESFTPEQVRNMFSPDTMMVEITNISPLPKVGWVYENGVFKEGNI